MRLALLTALLFPAFAVPAVHAQPYKPMNVSLSEGLSQSCVYSIVQDAQGFTWMATQDGLNRFDGVRFDVFRNEPFDTSTLSANFLNRLFVDSRGWLWVSVQHMGLDLYLPGTSGFRHFNVGRYPAMGHDNVNAIAEDRQGRLWLATAQGLSCLEVTGTDPATAAIRFTASDLGRTGPGPPPAFMQLFIDRDNHGWAAAKDTLYLADFEPGRVRVRRAWDLYTTPGLEPGAVTAFCQDAGSRLWIGGSHGVSAYDYRTGLFTSLTGGHPVLQKYIGEDYVSTVYTGSRGALWVGTATRGLFRLNRPSADTPIGNYTVEKISLGTSRLSNMVLCIHEDLINAGMIWVGTFAGGTYKLVPVLKNFRSDFLDYPAVGSPLVTAVCKDHRGTVWLGTPTGLYRYERPAAGDDTDEAKRGRCVQLFPGYVSAIHEDAAERLWIGTESGLYRMISPRSDNPAFRAYPAGDDNGGRLVRSLYRDRRQRLFAVLRNGIYRYDEAADRMVPFLSPPDTGHAGDRGYALSAMLIDGTGNLWEGSSMGLTVFLASENAGGERRARHYYHTLKDTASLRSHTIQCLTEDSRGVVWIGTANGLTRAEVDGGTVRFRNFSTANGIKNNLIYSVVEDPETGFLWLSTNGGLTRFDPTGRATANFDINDGLQSNEFNAGAYTRASDGEMLFGGIQGFTAFYPDQIHTDTVAPRVFITDFVLAGRRKGVEKDDAGRKRIDLTSGENSFTIDFIGLHYRDPARNRYAYRLEGFQSDWTSCGHSRQVNFSQLPPGTYVFEVIASNADGVYSAKSDLLTITIHPPFYGTVWFYLLLLFFIGMVLWGLHIYRLKMKMEQVREIERIRKETAADFHDELGHKLTTISWFSDITRKKLQPGQSELRGYLDKIIETSANMYLTMKDLLWAMDPEKDSVYHTHAQLIRFGHELFDHTGIEFTASEPPEELMNVDLPLSYKRHILLIFKEIMHNSLKHGAPANTFLDLERMNGTLTLRFGDDGTGFDPAAVDGQGHGLKNVMRRAEIIHATAGFRMNDKGTLFELNLKINKH